MAKLGRKPKFIDENVVRNLAKLGASDRIIAKIVSVDEDTLHARFSEIIDSERAAIGGPVMFAVSQLVQLMKEKDLSAIRYFLDRIAGLEDAKRIELTGKDGEPIQVNTITDLVKKANKDKLLPAPERPSDKDGITLTIN